MPTTAVEKGTNGGASRRCLTLSLLVGLQREIELTRFQVRLLLYKMEIVLVMLETETAHELDM